MVKVAKRKRNITGIKSLRSRNNTKPKKSKLNGIQKFNYQWGRASRNVKLLVYIAAFGLIGIATLLYSQAADTKLFVPKGANELVLSYEIGMPHTLYEEDFPTGMAPAMLLYGNGLMLCGQGHNTDNPLSFKQRKLNRRQVVDLYNSLKDSGFDATADREQLSEFGNPTSTGKFIRLNTNKGSSSASSYPETPSDEFNVMEKILIAECDKATETFDPDDIVVESIKQSQGSSDQNLPDGVPSDQKAKQSKSRRVVGQEAKDLKSKLSTKTKLYKANDGSVLKARYLPKVPEYIEPAPIDESLKGKVEAATLSQTRWLYVVAADQVTPTNASSVLSEHASSIQAYYKSKVGKTFTNAEISVVRGSKTAAQYRICPSGADCRGYVSLAIQRNLWFEYAKYGHNTNVLYSFDGTNGCMGWGASGNFYNLSSQDRGFASTTLKGCHWYDGSHAVAAHEAGHGFTLPHVCSASLMGSCGYSLPAFPGAPINTTQSTFLKDKSPYFNTSTTATYNGSISLKADFNGDGYSDIFWYAPGESSDSIWYGTSVRSKFDIVTKDVDGIYRPISGDFNGDGKSDIYWYAPGSASDSIWYGTATKGTFSSAPSSINGVYEPIAGDFDGDGFDDVIFYGPGSAADFIHFGTATLGKFVSSVSMTAVNGVYLPIPGDYNGDSYTDVIWYGPGSAADWIWYGSASRGKFTGLSINVSGTFRPTSGDFNGDGFGDILWYAPGTGTDTIWYGTRTLGGFSAITLPAINAVFVPIPGNFDGDKYDDLFLYGVGTAADSLQSGTALQGTLITTTPSEVNGYFSPIPY